MAILADTGGRALRPLAARPDQGPRRRRANPGSLCWVELYTPDLPAAAAFYRRRARPGDLGGRLPRRHVHLREPGGTGRGRMFGGIVPLADDPTRRGSGPYWLPYFEVTDTDATVRQGAGTGRQRPDARHGPGGRRPHRQARRPVRGTLRGDQERAAGRLRDHAGRHRRHRAGDGADQRRSVCSMASGRRSVCRHLMNPPPS